MTKEEEKELDEKLHKLKLYLIHNENQKICICRVGKSIILDTKIIL